MSRAIDLCTCGKDRADHGNATGHSFMPHPQPARLPDKTFPEKVWEFVRLSGHAWGIVGEKMFVELPNGETWELDLTLRKSNGSNGGGV